LIEIGAFLPFNHAVVLLIRGKVLTMTRLVALALPARSGPQVTRTAHSRWAKPDRRAPFEEQARLCVLSRSHHGEKISLLESDRNLNNIGVRIFAQSGAPFLV
jgi:hypothetical protein